VTVPSTTVGAQYKVYKVLVVATGFATFDVPFQFTDK
jgi:hypothetical protein